LKSKSAVNCKVREPLLTMPTNGAKSATKPEGGPDDRFYLPSSPFQHHQ